MSYIDYDKKINRDDDGGILKTADRYLRREWIFKANFKRPRFCVNSDTNNLCWQLPSDFIALKDSTKIIGIPYCWGSKMDINSFLIDINNLSAPGDVCGSCCVNKQKCESFKTTGIDCSGFVVKCFKITEKTGSGDVGTSNLAQNQRFSRISQDVKDLKKGDILLRVAVSEKVNGVFVKKNHGGHVVICNEINRKRNYCKIIHSGVESFFGDSKTKVKIFGLGHEKGVNQGVRVDSSDLVSLQKKLVKYQYTIYRRSSKEYPFVNYSDRLSQIILKNY